MILLWLPLGFHASDAWQRSSAMIEVTIRAYPSGADEPELPRLSGDLHPGHDPFMAAKTASELEIV